MTQIDISSRNLGPRARLHTWLRRTGNHQTVQLDPSLPKHPLEVLTPR